MNDRSTTILELKEAVRQMCIDKGWGVEGKQDPQHVAMAFNVEAAELLEQFQWLSEAQVKRLADGGDPVRQGCIAEEFADCMMYGLQLMYTLGIDVSSEIEKKIERVMHRPEDYSQKKEQMRDAFEREIRQ